MKWISILGAALLLGSAWAQAHTVPAHFDKNGKWVPARQGKDRTRKGQAKVGPIVKKKKKTPTQVAQDETAAGRHREHRYYSGHYSKNGKYVPGQWRWVWVKDKKLVDTVPPPPKAKG